ncbi:hypothetical protein KEM54_004538, partial [Ascosphaera aggregata]
AGVRRKQIQDLYQDYLLTHVDRRVRSPDRTVHTLAIAYAMQDLVHRVQQWEQRSPAFVDAMKARSSALILTMLMDGVAGSAQGQEEESQRYRDEQEPNENDMDECPVIRKMQKLPTVRKPRTWLHTVLVERQDYLPSRTLRLANPVRILS